MLYKSRWVSAVLAGMLPGAGHFYSGQLKRGLFVTGMFVLDIVAIVHFATQPENDFIPLITLFSLLIPFIYIFNIIDAVQSADRMNAYSSWLYQSGTTEFQPGVQPSISSGGEVPKQIAPGQDSFFSGMPLGLLLIVGGAGLLMFTHRPEWLSPFVHSAGSYAGAAIFIVGGVFLYLRERARK